MRNSSAMNPTRIFFFENTSGYFQSSPLTATADPAANPRYAALLWMMIKKNTARMQTKTARYLQKPLFSAYPVKTNGSERIKKPAYKLLLAETEIIL